MNVRLTSPYSPVNVASRFNVDSHVNVDLHSNTTPRTAAQLPKLKYSGSTFL